MTDVTLKLTNRRRRWFIAGVFLFAVTVSGWSHWPRVDQRFLGRWRMTGVGSDRSDDSTITLRANGMGYWPLLTRRATVEPFPWVIRDDRFVLGQKARSYAWWVVRDLLSRVTDRDDYFPTWELEIHEVTAEYIFMRHPKTHQEFTLYRIAD